MSPSELCSDQAPIHKDLLAENVGKASSVLELAGIDSVARNFGQIAMFSRR